MATTRDRLREMVDLLLEDRLEEAEAALTPLLDPVGLAFLNAPYEDEELTPEEIRAVEEARAELRRGEVSTLDEAMSDIPEAQRA